MKYLKYTSLATLLLIAFAANLSAAELTAEQVQKKKAYFLKFDADGNEALSVSEFVEMTKKQYMNKEKAGWEVEGKKRFARNDANGNGRVTFDEWLANQK